MDFRLAHDARAFAEAMLEEYAADVFDPHVVAARLNRAARLGLLSVQIQQDRSLDLTRTIAARSLCKALLTLGYEIEWVEVRRMEQGGRGAVPRELIHPELVARWHLRLFEP